MVRPAAKRAAATYLQQQHRFSQRRACRLLQLARATARCRPRAREEGALRQRLRELAAQRPRFGYRRLTVLLRREYGPLNHKRVYRLYRAEGLQVPRRRRKRVANNRATCRLQSSTPNEQWAMDFVHDTTAAGRPFRALTLVDTYTRECHAIEVARSLPSQRVICVLERLITVHGRPACIRVDNGPEFISQALDQWATRLGIPLDFITPGKPMENGHIESFNGKFRDECLNQHWFLSLSDAQKLIEAWRIDYNTVRPHSALGNLPPASFAERCRQTSDAPL
jgi:putative transposase